MEPPNATTLTVWMKSWTAFSTVMWILTEVGGSEEAVVVMVSLVALMAMVGMGFHFHFHLDVGGCWRYSIEKSGMCDHFGSRPFFSVVKRVRNARRV